MFSRVDYRVNSIWGTQFRIWAPQRLREYIVKGFTLDDERLKNSDKLAKKLDAFMNLNERDILTHAGTISHEIAKELAEAEYDKFHAQRIAESKTALSDFDKTVKKLSPVKKGARNDTTRVAWGVLLEE